MSTLEALIGAERVASLYSTETRYDRELREVRLASADHLIQQAQDLGVVGLAEKLSVPFGSERKFDSLLSEIEFAVHFAERGMDVEVLADDVFGVRRSPDLRVTDTNGSVYVEVKRSSSGVPNLHKAIEDAIERHELPFRILPILASETDECPGLSRPGVDSGERQHQEQLLHDVVLELVEHLRATRGSGDVNIQGHRFAYEPAVRGDMSGGVSGASFARERHQHPILLAAQKAAEKRGCFPPGEGDRPYIVAYRSADFGIGPRVAFHALIGGWCHQRDGSTDWERRMAHYPDVVRQACSSAAWAPLLELWEFLPGRRHLWVSEFGAFVTEPWAANLDGLLMKASGGTLHWFPNPWGRRASLELLDSCCFPLGYPSNEPGPHLPDRG